MRSARLFAVAVLAVVLAASLFSPVAAQGGTIEIRKVTTNGDTTTVFRVDGSGPGTTFGYDFTGGKSWGFGILDPGTYTVVETVPPGWVLDSISCRVLTAIVGSISVLSYAPQIDGSSWTVDLAHHSVTIDLVDGDTVSCTFTNSPFAPVGGVVIPTNRLALVAPWLAVIGLVGCIGAAVVVAKKRKR